MSAGLEAAAAAWELTGRASDGAGQHPGLRADEPRSAPGPGQHPGLRADEPRSAPGPGQHPGLRADEPRSAPGPGRVRVTFSRGDGRTMAITYELGARRATLDAGQGREIALSLSADPGQAADLAAWTCSCPAAGAAPCLHVALAARGLAEAAED
ncbi:MAG: hypothetical protein IT372_31240, partial [Polyangiaceae bacterium]|nr:hypothetical protein [Polyangiaceae bacterium]